MADLLNRKAAKSKVRVQSGLSHFLSELLTGFNGAYVVNRLHVSKRGEQHQNPSNHFNLKTGT